MRTQRVREEGFPTAHLGSSLFPFGAIALPTFQYRAEHGGNEPGSGHRLKGTSVRPLLEGSAQP